MAKSTKHFCRDANLYCYDDHCGGCEYYEKRIVKPYLEKLKAKMQERDADNGGEPLNAVDRGYHLACEHLFEEIDNLLTEKGAQKWTD